MSALINATIPACNPVAGPARATTAARRPLLLGTPHVAAAPSTSGRPFLGGLDRPRALRAVPAPKAVELPGEVDVEAAIKAKGFPIPPEELVDKAKAVLASNIGVENPDLLADSFVFQAPVVGPLPKETFLSIFGSFEIKDAFPDGKENYFGFTVDPIDCNRVWYFSRFQGTHTGGKAFGIEATGKRVEVVPTMSSLTFDEEGKATKLTTGYPVDKEVGNTGGLSLAFGIIYALNPNQIKIPEAQPYKMSWQFWLINKFLGGVNLGVTPK